VCPVPPGSVKRILDDNCTACHGTSLLAGAPMSLATWSDTQKPAKSAPSKKVFQLVQVRMNDAKKPMPQQGLLPRAQLELVDAWVSSGAPECGFTDTSGPPGAGGSGAGGAGRAGSSYGGSGVGGSGAGGPRAGSPGVGGSGGSGGSRNGSGLGGSGLGGSGAGGTGTVTEDCFELRAHNGQTPGDTTPFQVGAGPFITSPGQYYENFVFKAPYDKKVLALRMEPLIDNGAVLHHFLLFHVIKNKQAYRDGTHQTGIGTHPDSELVTGWAPGGSVITMPPGVGLELPEPGGLFELEIHYWNQDLTPKQDRSGVRICYTTEPLPNTATVTWLGTENINIPARSRASATGTCRPRNSSGGDIHIIQSVPHMHKTGVNMKTVINRPGGPEVLIDKPFKFEEQRMYETPAVLRPGESLTTTCTFDNTGATAIGFGTVSELEMCYNFVTAYPARALHNPGNSLEGAQNTCLH
jgi:hypothetical protein